MADFYKSVLGGPVTVLALCTASGRHKRAGKGTGPRKREREDTE